MLDHVSIAVDDIDRAEVFFDAIMAALAIPKVGRSATFLGYGERCCAEQPGLTYISIRLDRTVAPSPSRHWCFKASSRATVELFWQAGIANGGHDDGPPGLRLHYHSAYYAAFLLDPSGNRLEAVCHRAED